MLDPGRITGARASDTQPINIFLRTKAELVQTLEKKLQDKKTLLNKLLFELETNKKEKRPR